MSLSVITRHTQTLAPAKLVLAALLALATPLPAAPVPKQTPPAAWVFQMHGDPQTNPHTDVFLPVGTRQVCVLHQTSEDFHTLLKADYQNNGIPSRALLACAGWFAGAGENLYVIRRGRALVVYRKELDEQAPDFPWKRFKVIPLG